MRAKLRRRLVDDQSGMTLVELLNVVLILGILLAIAVPSYLSLKDRTNQTAAKSNLAAVLPAVIEYGTDNTPNSRDDPDLPDTTDTGYTAMSPSFLQSKYDPTIDTAKYRIGNQSATSYCIYTWVDAWTAFQAGPGQPVKVELSSSFRPLTCT